MPVISFIVPFRAPETTNQWDSVSQYLLYTVQNLLSQTCPDIEVYVMAHASPSCALPEDPRLHLLLVDEPLPELGNRKSMHRDRRRKLAHGCMAAAGNCPRYLMPVDADDRVHPGLAEFLNSEPVYPAWYLSSGAVAHVGVRRYYMSSSYEEMTSSSCILSLEEAGIPADTSFGEFEKCYWFLGHHKIFVGDMRARGHPARPIPFSGGAYILGNGANLSNSLRNNPFNQMRFYIRYFLFGRKLDESFRQTYGEV